MVSPWRVPSLFALVLLMWALLVTADVAGLSQLIEQIVASSANRDTEGEPMMTRDQWDSSKRSVRQGIEFFKERNLDLAQSHLLEAVKNDCLNGEAYFNLGVLSEEKHEYNLAITYYDEAIRIGGWNSLVRIKSLWNKAMVLKHNIRDQEQGDMVLEQIRLGGYSADSQPIYDGIKQSGSLLSPPSSSRSGKSEGFSLCSLRDMREFAKYVFSFVLATEEVDDTRREQHVWALQRLVQHFEVAPIVTNAYSAEGIFEFLSMGCASGNPLVDLTRPEVIVAGEKLQAIVHFAAKIANAVLRPGTMAREIVKGSKSSQDEAVLVVGSGVAGLSTAIEAVANGYDDVSIVEKRGLSRTRRKFWWDLIPSTVRRLNSYGFQDLSIPFHTEVEGIVAVQCDVLERFLELVALSVQVKIRFNTDFETLVATEEVYKFHFVFACDGTSSPTRSFGRIHSSQQNKVTTLHSPDHAMHLKTDLEQATIVLVFQMKENKTCPSLRVDNRTGKVFDAFAPSFEISGVTSVFKRFYEPFCEMQILFSHTMAQHNFETFERGVDEDWFPWGTLLEVTRNLVHLEEPLQSPGDLRNMLIKTSDGRASATFFKMKIIAADAAISRSLEKEGEQMVLLRGDALVSSYFRLGIGVNQIFETLPHVAAFLWQNRLNLSSSEIFSRHVIRTQAHLEWMVRVQTQAMFYETFCDNTIVDASNWQHLSLLPKNTSARRIGKYPLTMSELETLPCLASTVVTTNVDL